MNQTDLALITGHLEGWIGWHFTLKRKVFPKIHFLHCTAYTYNKTVYHPLIWDVLEEVRRLVSDSMSNAQQTLVAGWTLLLDVTQSSQFWTPLPCVQGHHLSHWQNSWSKYHSITTQLNISHHADHEYWMMMDTGLPVESCLVELMKKEITKKDWKLAESNWGFG